MARIRTIKPGFFTSEELASVSVEAQLLAGGLLCYADDEGYFNAHPALVKAAVFPLRETAQPVAEMLKALARVNYVRFGMGEDGKRYGFIVKFAEHQKVSHLTPSKIKKMEIVWEVSGKTPEDSVKAPEVLRPELNGIELNGTEGNRKPSARATRGANSKMAKATGGTRHTRVKELVENFYQEWAGAECPWDGGEGGQLDKLLKATPNWIDSQFVTCLENLARSDCIAVGSRPRTWLGDLMKYLKSPLDKFGKPIQGNGNGHNKAQQRELDRDAKWRAIASANPSHALSEGSGVGLRPRLEPGENRAMAVAAGNESTVHIAGNNGGVQRGTDQAARRVDGIPETS